MEDIFFSTLATKFISKIEQVNRDIGPFEFHLFCECLYDRDPIRNTERVTVTAFEMGRYSIPNKECIEECYQTMVRDIKEMWDICEINRNILDEMFLTLSILNDYNIEE